MRLPEAASAENDTPAQSTALVCNRGLDSPDLDEIERAKQEAQLSDSPVVRPKTRVIRPVRNETTNANEAEASSQAEANIPNPTTPPTIVNPKKVDHASTTSQHSPAMSPRKFANQRLVRLDELKGEEELEELSVQQMKDLLRIHRITYDHVLEKEELLKLLKRLWRHEQKMKAGEAIHTLKVDEKYHFFRIIS